MRANRSDLLTTLAVSFNGERWLLPSFLMLPVFILASDSSDAISTISQGFSGPFSGTHPFQVSESVLARFAIGVASNASCDTRPVVCEKAIGLRSFLFP